MDDQRKYQFYTDDKTLSEQEVFKAHFKLHPSKNMAKTLYELGKDNDLKHEVENNHYTVINQNTKVNLKDKR